MVQQKHGPRNFLKLFPSMDTATENGQGLCGFFFLPRNEVRV